MAQVTFSVRMDADLKEDFDSLCKELGMNASTAINIFARTMVRENRIPFEIKAPNRGKKLVEELRRQAEENGTMGMSLEEINAIIEKTRKGID